MSDIKILCEDCHQLLNYTIREDGIFVDMCYDCTNDNIENVVFETKSEFEEKISNLEYDANLYREELYNAQSHIEELEQEGGMTMEDIESKNDELIDTVDSLEQEIDDLQTELENRE